MPEQPSQPVSLSRLKYQVTSIVNTGPNGTVMAIADKEPGGGRYALRAIKRESDADDVLIERARAEGAASPKLGHASILKCYDFRVRRSWFQVSRAELLMEYVDGKTLQELGKLDITAAIAIFAKVAGALAHMHRRQVIHGDVRPSHIMVSRTGAVKVRRYGLSLMLPKFRDQIKLSGSYVAPEFAREKTPNAQTDLYGLGATMYHVLTGRAPGGLKGRTEGGKLSTPIALNPRIPAALNRLIIECIQLTADKRPPDMYEAVKQLEELAKDMAIDDEVLVGLAATNRETLE
jgi:serine/threonine-protein kinase